MAMRQPWVRRTIGFAQYQTIDILARNQRSQRNVIIVGNLPANCHQTITQGLLIRLSAIWVC